MTRVVTVLFLNFLFLVSSRESSSYCYNEDGDPYIYFGSKTSYRHIHATNIEIMEPDCAPVYMWAVIRHGTRNGVLKRFKHLTQLKEQIIDNHELHNRGALCPKDLETVKQWTYPWTSTADDNQLTVAGKQEMTSLAKRLNATFAPFFEAPRSAFVFKSASKQRTKDSAVYFTNALTGTHYSDANENGIAVDNPLLRFLPDSKEWRNVTNNPDLYKEETKFKNSDFIQNLTIDVSNRLGFLQTLSLDLIEEMYSMCAFESAFHPTWTIPRTSAFCTAFTPSQLELLDYANDLHDYYELGYGTPFNVEFPNPLIRDLITKLTLAAENVNQQQIGAFYFAHAETVIPTILKLGLYRDKELLKADTFEKMRENRSWKMSKLSPFAANIIAVLYKCPANDFNVMFYHNEHIVLYPGCSKGVCPLSWLQKKFSMSANLDPEEGPNYLMMSVIVASAIIVALVATFLLYKRWRIAKSSKPVV